MDDGLDRIERVQYPLCRVEILASALQILQVQLHLGNSHRGVDEGILRVLLVDLLGGALQEGKLVFVFLTRVGCFEGQSYQLELVNLVGELEDEGVVEVEALRSAFRVFEEFAERVRQLVP